MVVMIMMMMIMIMLESTWIIESCVWSRSKDKRSSLVASVSANRLSILLYYTYDFIIS